MLAKTQAAASTLSQLFAKRQVSKYYLAISDKKPKKKQGSVVGDMRKARNGTWMLSQHLTSPAVSQFFSQGLGNGLRLFVIKPWTGKTHQIRVMMKSLGSPILGDTNYKGSDSDRVYLHAFALQFAYQGNNITLTCPPEAGQHFTETSCAAQLPKIASPADLDWPKLKPGLIQAIGHSNDHQVWAEYD